MATSRLESLYRLVDTEAPAFLRSVKDAGDSAQNEREFQTRVTRHIEDFGNKADVDRLLREEYTPATRRADAVYNRLVIEYELFPSKSHGCLDSRPIGIGSAALPKMDANRVRRTAP